MSDITEKIPSYLNSKYNSITHGVLSKKATLAWENREEFDSLCVRLTDQFQPKTATDKLHLADLVYALWRKQRIVRAEKQLFENGYNEKLLSDLGIQIEEYESLLELIEKAENMEEIEEKLSNFEEHLLNNKQKLQFHIEVKIYELKSELADQKAKNQNAESGLAFISSEQQRKLMRYETHLDKKVQRLVELLSKSN